MMDKIELLGKITATTPDGRVTTMFREADESFITALAKATPTGSQPVEPPSIFSGVVLSKEGMGIVPLSEPPKNCIQFALENGRIIVRTKYGKSDTEYLVPRGSNKWVSIEFKIGQKSTGIIMTRRVYFALVEALCKFDSVLVEYDEPREPRRSEKQKFDKMLSSVIRTKVEIVQDGNN